MSQYTYVCLIGRDRDACFRIVIVLTAFAQSPVAFKFIECALAKMRRIYF